MALSRELRLTLAVAFGSALGALARHLAGIAVSALAGPGTPWGTLAVNVLGSLAIGFYATLTEPDGRLLASPAARQLVTTGVCGGFTTFSLFSLESVRLAAAGRLGPAALDVLGSTILWLLAVWIGHRLALRLNRLGGTR